MLQNDFPTEFRSHLPGFLGFAASIEVRHEVALSRIILERALFKEARAPTLADSFPS